MGAFDGLVKGAFDSLSMGGGGGGGGAAAAKLDATKQALLDACDATARGTLSSDAALAEIEVLIDELAELNAKAARDTGSSPDLTGKWTLMFTTEQELLGLMGNPLTVVYQTLDIENGKLGNGVEWSNGVTFTVDSTLSSDAEVDVRSNFVFKSAALTVPDIPILGTRTLTLPPIGKGWFDNVYLDRDLRLNRDLRGNTVVYQRVVELEGGGWL